MNVEGTGGDAMRGKLREGRKVLFACIYENIKGAGFTHKPTWPHPPEPPGVVTVKAAAARSHSVWEHSWVASFVFCLAISASPAPGKYTPTTILTYKSIYTPTYL